EPEMTDLNLQVQIDRLRHLTKVSVDVPLGNVPIEPIRELFAQVDYLKDQNERLHRRLKGHNHPRRRDARKSLIEEMESTPEGRAIMRNARYSIAYEHVEELEAENKRLRIGKAAIKARTTRMLKELTTRFNESGRDREWWYQRAMYWSERRRQAEATIQRVRDLHKPVPFEVLLEAECANEDCEHEDECPSWTLRMCEECDRLATAINPYYSDNGIGRTLYPCPTIRAVEGNPND
ncbi:hypothetical protein, partial [Timonella senegalensis]|uniref:hypothetical protein n=1 Tax=Timonella senegalensis TaxID=1465825 RepID=UPI0028A71AB2